MHIQTVHNIQFMQVSHYITAKMSEHVHAICQEAHGLACGDQALTPMPGALFMRDKTVSPGCDTREPVTPATMPEPSVMPVANLPVFIFLRHDMPAVSKISE
jgi:hypothetical protein